MLHPQKTSAAFLPRQLRTLGDSSLRGFTARHASQSFGRNFSYKPRITITCSFCESRRFQCLCLLSHFLDLAKNFRRLLSHGTRTKANLPPRSVPQTCLNPRKSNVSGFSPVFARSARTKRPKRITRVFSSANSNPNFPNRSVRFLWNFSESRRYWKFTTKSSANLVRYASP